MKELIIRLRGPGVGARLARGTLWSMSSATLVRGLGLLGAMVAARILGAEAFGQVGVVQQVVAMMGTLTGLGVGTTASRFIAASRVYDNQQTGKVLGATALWSWGSACVGGIALAILAPWIATVLLAAPAMRVALLAAVPLLVLSLVCEAQAGGLAGFEAFRAIATSNVISGLLGVPLQLLLAWHFGVTGFVFGLAAVELLRWLISRHALAGSMARAQVVWLAPRWADLAPLLRFGMPSTLAGMLVGPVLLVSFVIVGRQPQGYAEVGLFQATQQFRNLLLFVAVQSAAAIVPVLAAAQGMGDRAGLARVLRRAAAWALGSSLVLAIALVLFAQLAMRGFGEAFAGHWALLWWLALLAPVQALNAVGIAVLSAVNRPWMTLVTTVVFATCALATVQMLPNALGLILSQGLASIPALAVIGWAVRRDWNE